MMLDPVPGVGWKESADTIRAGAGLYLEDVAVGRGLEAVPWQGKEKSFRLCGQSRDRF